MRLISYATYKIYAKKYNINLSYINSKGKRQKKTLKKLAQEIYNYEHDNNKKGLYFN